MKTGVTTVSMIRDWHRSSEHKREPTVEEEFRTIHADALRILIDAWRAPRMAEELIDLYAKQYELMPKSRMTFAEFLIVRGVGE